MDAESGTVVSETGEGGSLADGPRLAGRRRKRTLLVISVAIVMGVVGTIGGAFLGASRAEDHWIPLYRESVSEAERWEEEARDWRDAADTWRALAQRHLNRLQALRRKIRASIGDLNRPHFVLWNSCGGLAGAGCPLRPGEEYIASVPDTFTYHVSFRSTVPVTVWIMSLSDFVCWETRLCRWQAVGWEDRTLLVGGSFHDAEGCGGYVAVFFSEQTGTLYPNVSVTRKPASHRTGVCR